jgi:hypothetical protein
MSQRRSPRKNPSRRVVVEITVSIIPIDLCHFCMVAFGRKMAFYILEAMEYRFLGLWL